MLSKPIIENLLIYVENLSYFYLICALVSFIAVWFTWNVKLSTQPTESKEKLNEDSDSGGNLLTEDSDESLNSTVSTLDRKGLIKSVESALTRDDRAKEREIERRQLMDILTLMRNDEQFKTTTMEELQEQLKLYRD